MTSGRPVRGRTVWKSSSRNRHQWSRDPERQRTILLPRPNDRNRRWSPRALSGHWKPCALQCAGSRSRLTCWSASSGDQTPKRRNAETPKSEYVGRGGSADGFDRDRNRPAISCTTVAPVSAFRRFGVSAFRRFGVSAFVKRKEPRWRPPPGLLVLDRGLQHPCSPVGRTGLRMQPPGTVTEHIH